MITIFCGEDATTARKQFLQAIEAYKAAQSEIINIQPSFILELSKGFADNLSLFSSQKVFCTENLEKFSFKKSTKTKSDSFFEALVLLSRSKAVVVLDFEDGKQARMLKLKDLAVVNEAKPATSIFKLIDEIYPDNKHPFITSFRDVCKTQDEMFIFVMLVRHIRLLVLALDGGLSSKIPPWQKYKVISQAKKWDSQKLIDLYSGMIKIEIGIKTSSNPYGISKSVEILACHYL